MGAALALILGFMAVEVVAGVLAHSLALVSDAAHMLTDAAALGLSLVALRLAARPARGAMTYGFLRVEALAAQANGLTLLVLAARDRLLGGGAADLPADGVGVDGGRWWRWRASRSTAPRPSRWRARGARRT